MASKIQICNLALSRIGASTITSLTENTTQANLCNTFIDDIINRVVAQGSWSTTLYRAKLAQVSDDPLYEFTYQYQLPTSPKCLRVLDINFDPNAIYRIEGDKLLSDDDEIYLRYIGIPETTDNLGPLLTECIEILLASYLAYPVTANASLAGNLKEEYQRVLFNNLALDGQQGSKEFWGSSDLIDIRL